MSNDWMNTSILRDPPPRFVAGYGDSSGTTSAESGRAFQETRAADSEARQRAITALAAEEARMNARDQLHSSENEGVVQPDGSIVFNDWRAREATPEGVKERDDAADRARAFYQNANNFKLYDGVMTPGKNQRRK